jgi:hypothetical protein
VKREFWTLFRYGGPEVICSKHRSIAAALRAAAACERRGGADHRILEVVETVPYRRLSLREGERGSR